jgi:transmembrane sensor
MNTKNNNGQIPHNFHDMATEEKIMWRSGQLEITGAIPKEEAYRQLMQTINRKEYVRLPKVVHFPVWRLIAACVAVLLMITGGWYMISRHSTHEIVAERGHHSDHVLPDGSKVFLNADTKIAYHKGNFSKKRNVLLNGEAFFNVEKGNAFTISTDNATIKVLGTSFNVYARENGFRLSCFTGKVMVTCGKQSITVLPQEMASIEKGKLVLYRDKDVYLTTLWRNGEFQFENTPLSVIFDEIERQYNVNFVIPDIEDKIYTCTISDKNLVEALDIVCIPLGLTYEIGSNGRIFIKTEAQ